MSHAFEGILDKKNHERGKVMRNLQIDESQLIHEPDPFYPPASQKHQEAFKTFFTADAAAWDEFFQPEDFNINPDCVDLNQHHMHIGLKLTLMFRDHFEEVHGDWEEA